MDGGTVVFALWCEGWTGWVPSPSFRLRKGLKWIAVSPLGRETMGSDLSI
jgi:hypothetical protein